MIIPIPILIIAIMIGMIVLGLIRPPLTVIIPLLGIYAILMLIPYILPNFSINQYLSIKYILLPVIGLAIGYGISILASKYMNVDIRSLLGLKQDQRGIKRPSNVISKPKVEKRTEIKPEDLDRLINETINELKSGASTNETLGSWIEYYDGWTDAIISISRRFMDIKGIAESMNKEVPFLLRARQYESKAAMLGLTLKEESVFKKQKKTKVVEEGLVVYVRPEEIANELMNDTQLISNYVNEFNNIVERLVHDNDISQYMGNSQVLVIYVDGVPRKLIMINR